MGMMAKENKRTVQAKMKSQLIMEEARCLGQGNERVIGQGVEKVTILENGTTRECDTSSDMERASFVEGHQSFSQTNNEFPMRKSMTNSVGFWGQKPVAENTTGLH